MDIKYLIEDYVTAEEDEKRFEEKISKTRKSIRVAQKVASKIMTDVFNGNKGDC